MASRRIAEVEEAARFAAMMEEGAALRRRLATESAGAVIRVVDACERAIRGGGRLFFCGNGGSAADAQHIAGELLNRFLKERKPYAGLALSTDTSTLTAIGNDYGYDYTFARQVEALGTEGDVLVAEAA